VLIRAVEPIVGVELMAARRKLSPEHRDLTNGPGKLCSAFAIDGAAYGSDLTTGSLFLSDGPRCKIARSARIGVDYAGDWTHRPWRFYDPESRGVSRVRARSKSDHDPGAGRTSG
jgi:DNA-3-methyladenine glycosylase